MVTLRATKKVLRYLPATQLPTQPADTALGDWYVNRIVVGRQPVLLFVNEKSLLPMLAPARDVKTLPNRLAQLVSSRLERLGISPDIVREECNRMSSVAVGKTADRSVVGTMVDFAKVLPYHLHANGGGEKSLLDVEAQLAKAPCRCTGRPEQVIWPVKEAKRLLGLGT